MIFPFYLYIWDVKPIVSRGTFLIKLNNQSLANPSKPSYLSTKDYLVSGEEFQLLHDLERDMLVTEPQPSLENLGGYYESEDYVSHTDAKEGLIDFLYQAIKKRSLTKKLKLIISLNKGTRTLLDIGAGTGDFLKIASDNGWDVAGVEPNQNAVALAKEKGLVLENHMDFLKGHYFDVVTLWHVLEHLPNLEETILKIEALVRPGGVLIIAVPNYKSFDAKFYKTKWAAFDVPRHLWHFSRNSMNVLFQKEMKLIKTRPMIFDSFYVSLLSEKHKRNSNSVVSKVYSLVGGFFVGLVSNMSAWRTKEYSSVIYCFKKSE